MLKLFIILDYQEIFIYIDKMFEHVSVNLRSKNDKSKKTCLFKSFTRVRNFGSKNHTIRFYCFFFHKLTSQYFSYD